VRLKVHASLDACLQQVQPQRLWAFSRHAKNRFTDVQYQANDALLFGPETRGLPPSVLSTIPGPQQVRLPMRPGNRSLNLSNAVAVAVFEAWRQQGFAGAAED